MSDTPGQAPKLPCPACQSLQSRVIEGRPIDGGGYRRRRECKACRARYTTIETFERRVKRYIQGATSSNTNKALQA